MSDCEHEMRDRLGRTWRALVGRLAGSEFPPHVIYETLAEVAAEGMVEQYGCSATSSMLRLRADALEAIEQGRLRALLSGEDAAPNPAYPPLMRSGEPPAAPPPPPSLV